MYTSESATNWPEFKENQVTWLSYFRCLFSSRVYGYIFKASLFLGVYMLLIKHPLFQTDVVIENYYKQLWWPAQLMLTLCTGGYLSIIGIGSVGLIPAIFSLGHFDNQMHQKYAALYSALKPKSLLLNLIVSGIFASINTPSKSDIYHSSIYLFFMMFLGSILFQIINHGFTSLTKCSLFHINVLLGIVTIIQKLSLSNIQQYVFATIGLAGAIVLISLISKDKLIQVRFGPPPRKLTQLKIKFSNSPGILFLCYTAISIGVVFDILNPTLRVFVADIPISLVIFAGFVVFVVVTEILLKLDQSHFFLSEVNSYILARNLAREHWKIENVKVGKNTELFLTQVFQKSFRYYYYFMLFLIVSTGVCIMQWQIDNPAILITILIAPLFAYSTARIFCQVYTTFSRSVRLSILNKKSGIPLSQISGNMDFDIANQEAYVVNTDLLEELAFKFLKNHLKNDEAEILKRTLQKRGYYLTKSKLKKVLIIFWILLRPPITPEEIGVSEISEAFSILKTSMLDFLFSLFSIIVILIISNRALNLEFESLYLGLITTILSMINIVTRESTRRAIGVVVRCVFDFLRK